jgi:hypothetical protein
MKKLKEVDTYIESAPEAQKEVLNILRNLIFDAVPNVVEDFKWNQPVYALEKNFAYLKSNKQHVNLGFFSFDKTEDPKGLLEGTGKSMRHIKISSKSDIDSDLLLKMIKQSAQV